jgi:hypothetical protein|tara:strand:- start:437 stop:820 length:384 start_codon:yes stop_codon:yes gene_type:complete
MIDAAKVLSELGISEWVLRGEPTDKSSMLHMFSKVTGTDSNGGAIEASDEGHWGFTWEEFEAKKAELASAEPMKMLRAERDSLIAVTDWWASSDRTMTTAQRAYRTALRDITSSATSLDDVVWPTKP